MILDKVYNLIESLFSSVKIKLTLFYRVVVRLSKIACVKKHLTQCQAHRSHAINVSLLSFSSSSRVKQPENSSKMCTPLSQLCFHVSFSVSLRWYFSSMNLETDSVHLLSHPHGESPHYCVVMETAGGFPGLQYKRRPKREQKTLSLKIITCPHDFIREVWTCVLPVCLHWPDAGKFVHVSQKQA